MKDLLNRFDESRLLKHVSQELSTDLEISSVLNALQGEALLFERVKGSSLRVAGNLYATRQKLRSALRLDENEDLSSFVSKSMIMSSKRKGRISDFDPSAWDHNVDAGLAKLPILKHYDREAGKYMTAGIVAAKFPGSENENLSFHRMLVLSKDRLTARIVPRHLEQIAKDMKGQRVPVSIIIGPPPAVFLAASLQTSYGQSEYCIANAMMNEKLELQSSELTDISVPKDSEIVLEGFLDYQDVTKEGPFVDLTGTYDEVREQPVFTILRMHYRDDSVYQAVLAGSQEHGLFMGLPQELKIRESLAKSIPKVQGINLTPSSNGYFHCIVSIDKGNDGDGKTAIMNCFSASHPLKLVIAVDGDIDPFDLSQVEWALATRFQADRGLVEINGAKGSSLDPSSGKSAVTSKLGLDATLPLKEDRSKFEKARITPARSLDTLIRSLGQD